ncbi:NTP transferase domain-containing protein [Caulobacter sp. SLTY]|uniref:nucleotidyltransferase family protein n=1 Tax=Caulobacter sp. SLTY TaxID=2683262 RepID=UPI001411F721|nr:nucleotidyltransferase family protein [Caulobacter sp. SLTY]NBB13928.1 NTP transferase domain-containing protein [Caulobacter sp. SLTY]
MATGGEARGLEAIVLAAGMSVRFGAPKLLASFNGQPLIHAALAAAFGAPARGVTVVTGGHAPAVTAAVEAFGRPVRVVHAPDHGEGLSASLRAGIGALPVDAAGVFVFLADMPWVPARVADRLAEALVGGAQAAAPVFEGRRGHPVLLTAALFEPIMALTGDHGAGHILAGLGERLALIPVSKDGILRDVDHPGDLA